MSLTSKRHFHHFFNAESAETAENAEIKKNFFCIFPILSAPSALKNQLRKSTI